MVNPEIPVNKRSPYIRRQGSDAQKYRIETGEVVKWPKVVEKLLGFTTAEGQCSYADELNLN